MAIATSCRLRLNAKFGRFLFQKRSLIKSLTAQRRYISDPSNFASSPPTCGLEQYRDLQRYFTKKMRATYQRFSSGISHSMVCGPDQVYFIDSNVIYRTDTRTEQTVEQVLDLNQVLKEKNCTVQRMRLSPQEKYLAVTIKEYHKKEAKCLIVNLRQETFFPHEILTLDKVFSFEWATDDLLFYTTLDDLRSSAAFSLDLSKNRNITPVFQESRLDVFVEVSLTRDQKLLTINCNNRNSSEVLIIDKESLTCEPLLVQRRTPDLLYHVEHWNGLLIILTNTGPGQEYQVVQTSMSQPSVDSWLHLYCPPPGYTIKDMDVIGDFCVLTTRTPDGQMVLVIVSLNKPDEVYVMELPSWACALETKKGGGADKTSALEFLISSPVHPPMCFCLRPEEGLVLSDKRNKNFTEDVSSVITSRLEAFSKDGTLVPITLFHAAHAGALDKTPLLVHVYGSYGRDLNMEFCSKNRFLLEQGWALAYCHIRGGGECGLSWYRQARVEGKHKSVEDLVACIQHLFRSGVSSSSLTALAACSAGAVPVGVLCNQHPHLIKAVTLQAPFLDVLETLEDSSLPLTIEDREEWGDAGNPAHKQIIAKYCPLHNITPQMYPSMLLTAYKDDVRVNLSGVVKYAEKLQKAIESFLSLSQGTDVEEKPKVFLNIQPGANHQGQEDFDLRVDEDGLELAFLYTELGLNRPRHSRKKKRP